MFAVLACKVKMNAPRCHTYLEIIYTRYGRVAHLIFLVFALITNILVGSQLLLGGSAVVTALTGMNVYAAIFLIPIGMNVETLIGATCLTAAGVCAYVVLGGLRATFLCDYSHTLILMIIMLYFMFNTYAISDLIGSPGAMYELLQKAAMQRPVEGNQNGSYVTLKSNFALVFGIIQLCSGSGTVFLDQAYWQRAIASRPTTAVRAYLLGGMAWFAIPFGFSTTLGLAAIALTDNPRFPTYPNPPTEAQISSGLAAAFSASALLGKSGAVALLIVLFMAVTSCASAELIAVSSILTFDVFKTYIKPSATPNQLIFVSHIMICVFGLTMAVFACIWNAIGIDLGWLFLVMGLIIGGAVFPVAFAITWKGQTRAGAISGSLSGLAAGLIAWLAEAKRYYGTVNVSTTGQEYPTLAGNLAALMTGLIVSVVVSLVWKEKEFDWHITRAINMSTASTPAMISAEGSKADLPASRVSIPQSVDEKEREREKEVEKSSDGPAAISATAPTKSEDAKEQLPTVRDEEAQMATDAAIEESPQKLRSAFRLACWGSFFLTISLDFLWPIPMFLSHYIFSKPFFTGWVVVSFIWVFSSAFISTVLPIWETWRFFGELAGEIWHDLGGGRRKTGGRRKGSLTRAAELRQ